MTLGWWALLAAAALIAVSSRRSPYEGTAPRVWWEEQRMYRRPTAIGRRAGRVLLAVALFLLAFAFGAALVAVALAALIVGAALAAGCFWARTGAARAEPAPTGAERIAAGDLRHDLIDRRPLASTWPHADTRAALTDTAPIPTIREI